MGILERIAEIESEVCIASGECILFVISCVNRCVFVRLDGPDTTKQGHVKPSWVVESSTGQAKTRVDHPQRWWGRWRRRYILYFQFSVYESCDMCLYSYHKFVLCVFISQVRLNITSSSYVFISQVRLRAAV